MIAKRLRDAWPPLAFGFGVLIVWEALVRGFGVPGVILPAPSAIAARLVTSVPTLTADFVQTIRGVLAGYLIGSSAGLLIAILIGNPAVLRRFARALPWLERVSGIVLILLALGVVAVLVLHGR